jgi:o-succinylbenzoate---CoA ligase
MGELVAVALPGGLRFVETIQSIWEAGDAFTPLDPRLPEAERDRVFESLRPSRLISADGSASPLEGGVPIAPGDAFVIATSGTTGLPKGVVHTHASMQASANATSEALQIDPTIDHWLACLPLAHIGGLSVVLRALTTKTKLTVHPSFDASRVQTAALREGVTRVSLVTRALAQVDPSHFRTVLLGGAVPPADRPANCIATYGMTETGSGIVYERRVLDGVELRTDESGEIEVRGSMLLRAYRANGFEWDPKDEDGWFATGDLGSLDRDGVLSVHGRAGDVIVTGGEKVWPVRVEPILAADPAIAEVAITGRADGEWGHIVVAHVVPANPQHPPTLDQLRDLVKETLPSWYAPRALQLHNELPKTASGKVKRHELP